MSKPLVPGYKHAKGALIYAFGGERIGIILASSATVPADATQGYAPGCIFIDIDAAAGSQMWINEGTLASSLFVRNVTAGASGYSFTGRLTTTDGVASGTAKVIGGLAYSNVAASSAVTSTSTETLFDTFYTIPANTLKAGTVVKIRYQGIQTAVNSTDTLQVKLYLGGIAGTALITHASTAGVSNGTISGEYQLIVRTAGTSGTVVGCGTYKSVVAAEGTATYKDDILASTTVNTTTTQVIGVAASFNSTSAGNSVRLDNLTVEIY